MSKLLAIGKIIYIRKENSKNVIYILDDGGFLIKHLQLKPIAAIISPPDKVLKTFKDVVLIESEYLLSALSIEMLYYALKERAFITNKITKFKKL